MNFCITAVQLSVAAAFVSIPLVRSRFGATATEAAHAELRRRNVRTSRHEAWAPVRSPPR
ncbi:hypothetical protein ACFVHB_17845 [Kitasatospora sp. NPDC127111]|uniref:hypothetical protein n=1 Tax=Kitasatospora sp. NPDC127111 TaxID=3345363 RepID=UPI00363DB905